MKESLDHTMSECFDTEVLLIKFFISIRSKWVKLEKSYRKLPTIGLSFQIGRESIRTTVEAYIIYRCVQSNSIRKLIDSKVRKES